MFIHMQRCRRRRGRRPRRPRREKTASSKFSDSVQY